MFKLLDFILFHKSVSVSAYYSCLTRVQTSLGIFPEHNMGPGKIVELIIALGRSGIQKHEFHYSPAGPYFPLIPPAPAWAHYLDFGLLCKLLWAVVSCTYHIDSQSASTCRDFRIIIIFFLCISQMREEAWGGYEASRVPVGLRLYLSIHFCTASPSPLVSSC